MQLLKKFIADKIHCPHSLSSGYIDALNVEVWTWVSRKHTHTKVTIVRTADVSVSALDSMSLIKYKRTIM